jgi:hypothetical protein
MNSSKEHFGSWKKESQLIVLAYCYAEAFYDIPRFRSRILASVLDPRLQLDLISITGILPVNRRTWI